MTSGSTQSIEIFFCYAHEDKPLRDKLDQHLVAMKHSGVIRSWYDGEIVPGESWKETIKDHLNRAQIILLLISVSFLNSDYCYRIEMKRAFERHNAGTACVIPVLLRAVYLKGTPISELQMLPTGAKPIAEWQNRDTAFNDVAEGIARAVNQMVLRLDKTANPDVQERERVGRARQNESASLSARNDSSPVIFALAWSPDGRYIALGSEDGAISVLDSVTEKQLHLYYGPPTEVRAVAWSPDSKHIASGSADQTVQVWDAVTGVRTNMYTQLGKRRWWIHALAWSPGGKRIAAVAHELHIW